MYKHYKFLQVDEEIRSPDINHFIQISAPISQVYDALTTVDGLTSWWTEEITGDEEVGGKLEFLFKSSFESLKGRVVMEVIALKPPQKIQWNCLEGPIEWIGTDLTFDLSEEDDQTNLYFKHANWLDSFEVIARYEKKWEIFLLSLKDYLEKGVGQPLPFEIGLPIS